MTKVGMMFIHGYNSSPETWQVNGSGQALPYQSEFSKNHLVVNAYIPDYAQPDQELILPLLKIIQSNEVSSWIIVTHSLGIRLGLALGRVKGLPIKALIGLDPTSLDEFYQEVMVSRGWNKKIISSHDLLPARIIVRIHLGCSNDNLGALQRPIQYYGRFVGANLKSVLQIHPNKGHMIHWTDCPKIMESIHQVISQK